MGKFLGINDLVSLYNWGHVVQNIVMVFGVYIAFRTLAANIFIRISLIPILLYSSFMFSPFRQAGVIYQFVWVPYVTYLLLRIVYNRDYRWHNWLILAALIGINWQSYYSSGMWVLIFFFSLGLLLFRRDLVRGLLKSDKVVFKFAVTLVIVVAMMMPNIIVMLEKDRYVFPARMKDPGYQEEAPVATGSPQQHEGAVLAEDHGILMPYSLITHTGTFSSIRDFIQIVYPEPNPVISGPGHESPSGSEAYMYVGLLPWVIALLGFVVGKDELKSVWLFIAIAFGLLILGPAGGLHRLLYYIYPPLWFTRHMHCFVLFFLFAVLYFYVLGFNHLFSSWNASVFPIDDVRKGGFLKVFIDDKLGTRHLHTVLSIILFSGSLVFLVHWTTKLRYPETHYLSLLIVLVVVIGWIFRNDLGKKGIFAGLVAGHIAFVLLFYQGHSAAFFKKSLLLLGLPLCLLLLIKTHKKISRKRYIVALLLIVFSASLVRDLSDHLTLASYLYRGQTHPREAYGVKTDVHSPEVIHYRRSAPLSVFSGTAQSIRYLSLVYRQPYVLSPVMGYYSDRSIPYPHSLDDLKWALSAMRWSSFLLLRNYFEIINSGIPPSALEEMFCVGKASFQFKHGVVAVADNGVSTYLKTLGSENASRLLEKCVLVNKKDIDASLAEFRVSETECETLIHDASPGKGDMKANNHFSYTVGEYEYDSLNVDIVTAKGGILYWSDGYDEWWRAYVNGQEVPVYRTNVNFKAVVLHEGVNNIRFVYNPIWFKVSLLVFYGSMMISILGASVIYISSIGRRLTNTAPSHQSPAT